MYSPLHTSSEDVYYRPISKVTDSAISRHSSGSNSLTETLCSQGNYPYVGGHTVSLSSPTINRPYYIIVPYDALTVDIGQLTVLHDGTSALTTSSSAVTQMQFKSIDTAQIVSHRRPTTDTTTVFQLKLTADSLVVTIRVAYNV